MEVSSEYQSPKPPECSFFKKPIKNVIPSRKVSLLEVYHLIKGNQYAMCTSTLRTIDDPKKAREYKALNFDYVTFSGTFSKRNDASLQQHSNLLTIDFDHIEDITALRSALLQDQYFETELLFVSPSGDGLKWIIPIELTQVDHQTYFQAVTNYILHTYQIQVDKSGRDPSRPCFLPHDPNIYFNPKYL